MRKQRATAATALVLRVTSQFRQNYKCARRDEECRRKEGLHGPEADAGAWVMSGFRSVSSRLVAPAELSTSRLLPHANGQQAILAHRGPRPQSLPPAAGRSPAQERGVDVTTTFWQKAAGLPSQGTPLPCSACTIVTAVVQTMALTSRVLCRQS